MSPYPGIFSISGCLPLEHTCLNAADEVRCGRTCVVRASKQRYVKIEGGGLIHFRSYVSNFEFSHKLPILSSQNEHIRLICL